MVVAPAYRPIEKRTNRRGTDQQTDRPTTELPMRDLQTRLAQVLEQNNGRMARVSKFPLNCQVINVGICAAKLGSEEEEVEKEKED